MNLRGESPGGAEGTGPGRQLLRERRLRMAVSAGSAFGLHLLYALYHGALGVLCRSVWFAALCAYYIVLSAMRFSVILCGYGSRSDPSADMERFVMRFCGGLLILLSIILAGTNYISLSQNIAIKRDEIVMITIAAYTFTKLAAVIVKAVKRRKDPSMLLAVLRNISYAEIAASILTLQRSMLVSFGEMEEGNIRVMNILSGSAVFLFVLALGIAAVRRGAKKKG